MRPDVFESSGVLQSLNCAAFKSHQIYCNLQLTCESLSHENFGARGAQEEASGPAGFGKKLLVLRAMDDG